MWRTRFIEINGRSYQGTVKFYEEGSIYGIDEGRISKLEIKRNGKTVCNYDRGWDIEPKDEETKEVYKRLLKEFN